MAAIHQWNKEIFDRDISPLPGIWFFVDSKDQLNKGLVYRVKPSYIFFLHWSWKVPKEILDAYQCVAFHMTDVPYGRGGSPLQNLIVRGHKTTKLTALRMTEEFDAGPVYLKRDLNLDGSAQEIYIRASRLAANMIREIIQNETTPVLQEGDSTIFKRRRPDESEIPEVAGIEQLYDFIRMLDADGYPRAFLNYGGHRYEFSNVSVKEGQLKAEVDVTALRETPT